MSLTIHCKYKYFDSTIQRAEDRRQKFHFCRLPFAVNVELNLSNKNYRLQNERGARFENEAKGNSKMAYRERSLYILPGWKSSELG